MVNKNLISRYLLTRYFIVFLFSCNSIHKNISVYEVKNWIENEENGYINRKIIGDIEFRVTYLPPEYLALQEIVKISKVTNENEYKNKLLNYQNTFSFNLRIKIGDGSANIFNSPSSNFEEGINRVEYFLSKFKNDILFISDNDTLFCAETFAENNFNLSPYTDITILFFDDQNKINGKDFYLSINDKFFGTSYTNYHFDKKNIEQFPNIEF